MEFLEENSNIIGRTVKPTVHEKKLTIHEEKKKKRENYPHNYKTIICPQEVAQSAGTTPHEAEVTSSNLPPPSCVDMSKNKKIKQSSKFKFNPGSLQWTILTSIKTTYELSMVAFVADAISLLHKGKKKCRSRLVCKLFSTLEND
jgi:hypothetical protein